MYCAPIAKAHLVLGGMHIHIHLGRIQLQVQHKSRVAAVVQHIPIGLLHRVGDQPVANNPPVDEKVLQVCLATRERGQTHPTPQLQGRHLRLNINGLLHKRRAANRGHPPLALRLASAGLKIVQHLAVMAQTEGHVEARQGQALDHFFQVIEFGLFRAHELAPGRGIKKQVAHFHGGTARMGRRLHLHFHIAPLAGGTAAFATVFIGIAGEGQAGHGADTGQGLTAKPQAVHSLQVFQRGYFAGGVAGQGQRQVVSGHADAVVAYADQLAAAGLHVYIHPGSTRIKAVFQHFLNDRRGAFHHFASGNLVGQPGAEQMNSGHWGTSIDWCIRL